MLKTQREYITNIRVSKKTRIPTLALRTGKVNRPDFILGDVLNLVDTAGIRQIQLIYNACGQRVVKQRATRPWQVMNSKARRAS